MIYEIVYKAPNGNILHASVEAKTKAEAKKAMKRHWPEKEFIQFNKY